MTEGEREYSIAEAAKLLGCSTDTIRRRIKKGEIQAEKKDGPFGLAWYVKESQLAPARQLIEVVKVERALSREDIRQDIAEGVRAAVKPQLEEQSRRLELQAEKIENLGAQVEYLRQALEERDKPLPWYKRIFKRG